MRRAMRSGEQVVTRGGLLPLLSTTSPLPASLRFSLDMKHFPFKVVSKDGNRPSIKVNYKGEEKDCMARDPNCAPLCSVQYNMRAPCR